MRLLVCGSRTFSDSDLMWLVLEGFRVDALSGNETLTLIQGGAKGADSIAAEWFRVCVRDGRMIQEDADWDGNGKAAGPIRNRVMLERHRPELVLAFVDKPLEESKGTAHMARIAREAGVRTVVIEVHP